LSDAHDRSLAAFLLLALLLHTLLIRRAVRALLSEIQLVDV
jgi:hypothetical protein